MILKYFLKNYCPKVWVKKWLYFTHTDTSIGLFLFIFWECRTWAVFTSFLSFSNSISNSWPLLQILLLHLYTVLSPLHLPLCTCLKFRRRYCYYTFKDTLTKIKQANDVLNSFYPVSVQNRLPYSVVRHHKHQKSIC